MSRTKVKQNLIDASFGNILEQIAYMADGRTISTSAGNITVPNVTAGTNVTSTTHIDVPGTNIAYTPPSGTTMVLYEVRFSYGYGENSGSSGRMSPAVKVTIDGTQINNSRKAHLATSTSFYDSEMSISVPILIAGASDDIANMKVSSWGSSKTLKTQIATYSSTYQFRVNQSYHYAGTGAIDNIVVPPFIKITAYS